ncbi:DUF4129 domain-containing protein [Smaragdicoccus niigatensis]|uniref:DUF4129 domain-containing protein n=1 Tax=Smaragdicoccus niigatensis TaxID=359359 RepID=UPI0003608717|nr:DUF4129 domain-containing protein [Smaragdicoccus niigatensis]
MRNLVLTGKGGAVLAAVLLVATGIAVRVRPSGTVGPMPGPSVSGFWPTLAVTTALLVAVIATTAGAVSVARKPRVGQVPEAPPWDWPEMRIRISYVALAFVAVVAALIVLVFARRDLVPSETDVPAPPQVETAPQPPPPTTGPQSTPATPDTGGAGAAIALVVVATISLVILGGTLRATIRRRLNKVGDVPEPGIAPRPPEPLVRATEMALQEVVQPGRKPGDAIIACFATMERALAHTEFAPRPSDTAKEVIDRAVEHDLMPVGPAGQLRDLFTEARFSVHEMTATQRDSAATALQDILARWRS